MKHTLQEPTRFNVTESYLLSPLIKWKKRKQTRVIILHDSHTTPDIEHSKDYLLTLGRKMGLLDIGYHAVIERDGVIQETRDHALIGSHTPGLNMDSIGLCLLGGMGVSGPEDNFTYSQRSSLMLYMRRMESFYGELQIKGHSEIQRHLDETYRCPALDMDMVREDYDHFKRFGVLP